MKKVILLSSIFLGLGMLNHPVCAEPIPLELIAHQTALAPTEANIKKLSNDLAKKFPDQFILDESRLEKIGKYKVPILYNGNVELNNNQIAYSFAAKNNAVVSIFAKANNDFVRVATNLKKEDGSSARGTVLDRLSLAYKDIKNGKSYLGKMVIFGQEYLTQYDPIRDANQNIIGILAVGIPISK